MSGYSGVRGNSARARDDHGGMKRLVAFTSLAALALVACGSGDDGAISVDGAWARTSAAGQTTGAVYFDLTTPEDDRLITASVPASVAAAAEIHEVVPADMSGDDMSDDDMSEGEMDMGDDMSDGEMAMTMQELVDGLALAAGETVTFEPGGYHVMLLDIVEPLEAGDEIELTLVFESAADLTVTVEVADSAP